MKSPFSPLTFSLFSCKLPDGVQFLSHQAYLFGIFLSGATYSEIDIGVLNRAPLSFGVSFSYVTSHQTLFEPIARLLSPEGHWTAEGRCLLSVPVLRKSDFQEIHPWSAVTAGATQRRDGLNDANTGAIAQENVRRA